jgi:hypothetical protein
MVQFFIALFLSFFFFGVTWVITQNVIAAIVVAAVTWFFSFLGLCLAAASHHYEEKSFSSDQIQAHQANTRPMRIPDVGNTGSASVNK